jgi:hypothetical protein
MEKCFILSKSLDEDLVFDPSVSVSGWLRRVEDAFSVMLNTSTAGSLPVAFDFSVSAADTGIGRSTGNI